MFEKNYKISIHAYIGAMQAVLIENGKASLIQTPSQPHLSSYAITPYLTIGKWHPRGGAARRLSFHDKIETAYTSTAASLRAAKGASASGLFSLGDNPVSIAAAVFHHSEQKTPDKTMHALSAYAQAMLYTRILENNGDILKPRDQTSDFSDSVDRMLLSWDHENGTLEAKDLQILPVEVPTKLAEIREEAKALCVAQIGNERLTTFDAHFDQFYQRCTLVGFFK